MIAVAASPAWTTPAAGAMIVGGAAPDRSGLPVHVAGNTSENQPMTEAEMAELHRSGNHTGSCSWASDRKL